MKYKKKIYQATSLNRELVIENYAGKRIRQLLPQYWVHKRVSVTNGKWDKFVSVLVSTFPPENKIKLLMDIPFSNRVNTKKKLHETDFANRFPEAELYVYDFQRCIMYKFNRQTLKWDSSEDMTITSELIGMPILPLCEEDPNAKIRMVTTEDEKIDDIKNRFSTLYLRDNKTMTDK